ncbi:amidohydrolase family protein [Alcaligenaceae bacterium]|nr:amidohydrolase family protein [Alcaligenaceae bacterium]
MDIIDFCVRPPFGSFLRGDVHKKIGEFTSTNEPFSPPASAQQRSMDLFIAEMSRAGVIGVAMMRRGGGSSEDCDNSDLDELERIYPGRLIGAAAVDAFGGVESIREIEKYVLNGSARCVVMEPVHTYAANSGPFDDERIFPIYQFCQDNNIPIILNWGGTHYFKTLKYFLPHHIDNVATTFSRLKMVLHHGGWPYVREACLVALRSRNVYLAPSPCISREYIGSDDFVSGANLGVIREQLVFSSAYPLVSFEEAIDRHKKRGFNDESLQRLLYDNARDIFDLSWERER